MSCKIPLLKNLHFFHDENGDGSWVLVEDVFQFLKSNHITGDEIKDIRKNNIVTEIRKHKNGHKIINGKPAICFTSLLRYIFNHCDQLNISKRIVNQIEHRLGPSNESSILSVKSVYTEVSKLSYRNSSLESDLFSKVEINEKEIATLYSHYKSEFSTFEWQKICLFELHFSKAYADKLDDSFENLLQKRYDFLEKLKYCKQVSKDLDEISKSTVKHRFQRQEAAEECFLVKVEAEKIHIPNILENQIRNYVNENGNFVSRIACVGCTDACCHGPSIHVYCELQTTDVELPNVITLIKHFLQHQHGTSCHEIIFCIPGAFKKFTGFDGSIERFHLRDAVLNKKFNIEIFHCWNSKQSGDGINDKSDERCERCFNLELPKPLHWKDFHYGQEWLLDVPLIIQILLESFINDESLRKSDNVSGFIKSKVIKLYTLFDSLLNISNKNYIGVFQDVSTQDLSMNYKSISTVFAITSTSGVTLSLREAEERMKAKANSDLCYYNTFLKKHQIEYETEAGNIVGHVSLRDCILVLMLDNLVRLKYHSDPEPGENRSNQICTLPITIKGIPRDAIDVTNWHDSSVCDGTLLCPCKKERKLEKEDVKTLVLSLLPEEENCQRKFQKLCTWGFRQIWESVYRNGTLKLSIQDFKGKTHPSDDISTIENEAKSPSTQVRLELIGDEFDEIENAIQESDRNNEDNNREDQEPDGIASLLDNIQDYEVDQLIRKDFDDFEEEFFKPLDDTFDECTGDFRTEMSIDESFSMLSIACDEYSEDLPFDIDDVDTGKPSKRNLMLPMLFEKSKPPPLITRHPPPATGRDDDINKLREVLDDILIKVDCRGEKAMYTKILFAPDHKIGNNLLKLVESKKYSIFLPEFPILHLRKSKITNLCSAYKNAGILHILKYMRDEDFDEWKKLISAEHIEKATQYIRRIGLALHTAFVISFMQTMPGDKAEFLLRIMTTTDMSANPFEEDYEEYLANGKKCNATFALHLEIMHHCDEISALAFAERIGGDDGYNLMLASVKSSLPFSFLNGATSYAAYCTRLLHEHYKCGPFYANMKKTLFSTPHKGSVANFGLDTQREMEHKDVLKGFRSGATMTSLLPRMSLVDSMLDVQESRAKNFSAKEEQKEMTDDLGLDLSDTDLNYILRLTELFITRGAVSATTETSLIKNVYSVDYETLPESILDSKTNDIGHFLIQKCIAVNNLFGCTKSDIPDPTEVPGPKVLLNKMKSAKGFTIRRNFKHLQRNLKTERQTKEDIRQKLLSKSKKELECMSSEMNACQAIVKPDCSKPKVQKSQGIQKALVEFITKCIDGEQPNTTDIQDQLQSKNLLHLRCKDIPEVVSGNTTIGTLEFAGIKFKANVISGSEYLQFIENGILNKIARQFPRVKHLAVCEEKYKFTPDDFKSATRNQRQQKKKITISHLKSNNEMLSSKKFDRASLITTAEGKSLISTYLAMHAADMSIKKDITIDIDSELNVSACMCINQNNCCCSRFATPIRCTFSSDGKTEISRLENIRQRKGEAEMAQIDWLLEYLPLLQPQEGCVSIVTSGDIDSVLLHMYSISYLWPRNDDGEFLHPVYVILQKPGGLNDIYNITRIVSSIENGMKEMYFGMKVAIVLSIGGNDFLPKFYGITHLAVLDMFIKTSKFRDNLFTLQIKEKECHMKVNEDIFLEFIKSLYCPKRLDPDKLEFEEVRQITVRIPKITGQGKSRNPQSWMPPSSALRCLLKNINCLIEYYKTAGDHGANLPNFITQGCFKKSADGDVEYSLGTEVRIGSEQEILSIPEELLFERMKQASRSGKRQHEYTPQKGQRRKKALTSTPKSRIQLSEDLI